MVQAMRHAVTVAPVFHDSSVFVASERCGNTFVAHTGLLSILPTIFTLLFPLSEGGIRKTDAGYYRRVANRRDVEIGRIRQHGRSVFPSGRKIGSYCRQNIGSISKGDREGDGLDLLFDPVVFPADLHAV